MDSQAAIGAVLTPGWAIPVFAVTFAAVGLGREKLAEPLAVDTIHDAKINLAEALINHNLRRVVQPTNDLSRGLPRTKVGRRDDVFQHPTPANVMELVA